MHVPMRIPVTLLVLMVALSPLRGFADMRALHAEEGSRGHHHHHSHDGEIHSHFHHHGEGGEEEPGDHHGLMDQAPDQAKTFWTAPRRTEIDPPPSAPPAIAGGVEVSEWQAQRRAKPPPLVQFIQPKIPDFIKTVVLLE